MDRLRPPDPPLRDGDVLLRLARPSDAPQIREIYSERELGRWMLWDDEPFDEAEALRNIARSEEAWEEGSWAVFRIADAASDLVVGGVNLRLAPYDVAEVSYFLRESARGRGMASRAVRLACRWGFDEVGLQRVFLRCHPANAGSVSLARRCGFTFEGVERSSAAFADGTRFDSHVYSLLPGDLDRSTG